MPEHSDVGQPPERRKPTGWSRRTASLIVWTAVLYSCTAGFVSIVPQVFWPEPPAWALAAMPESCGAGLHLLKEELLERASDQIAGADRPARTPLGPWLGRWDDRHLAMEGRCTEPVERDAHATLGQLRHHTETLLRRFQRHEGRIAQRLDRELRALPQTSGETPP
jgi:hypothetical protein